MPLTDKQIESIVESDARLNIWEGSVRSGKTFGTFWRWFEFIKNAPKTGTLLMVGKTHKTLQRNVLDPIKELVGKHRCHYNRGTSEFHLLGKKCDLIGANDERAQDQIRGSTVAGAYCDELTLFPESFFTMLLSRMSVEGSKLFGTTNPDSPYHWLKTNYLDRADELDIRRFHFTIDDNTYLDPAYVKAIKKEYQGVWYKRFIQGLWVAAEGIIYSTVDEDRHFIDVKKMLAEKYPGTKTTPPRSGFPRNFVAVDYGTTHPFAAGLFGYDRKLPCYMIKEYYFDGSKVYRPKTDREYAIELRKWLGDVRPTHIYVDPNARSFIAELRRRRFNVVEADNSVVDGIRFVNNMINQDKLFFDKSCINTRKEFFSYVWDSKAQEKGEDKPIKKNDHCMDMIRYGVFTHFFKTFPVKLVGFNYK